MQQEFKYWVFISYSNRDKKWSDWLFNSLEKYHIPKQLIGNDTKFGKIPKRINPIFRDREEFPASTNLGEKITNALEQSRCLVVICSQNSAKSAWVNEEIKIFKGFGRSDRIFTLIIDGEPNASIKSENGFNECFPKELRSDKQPEPIAADVRTQGDGKENAKLKLLAGVLGLEFDKLKRREFQKKKRWYIKITVFVLVILCLIILLAISTWESQRLEEKQTRIAQSNGLVTKSQSLFPVEYKRAFKLAYDAALITYVRDGFLTNEASSHLYTLLNYPFQKGLLIGHKDVILAAEFSPDGEYIITRSTDADAWLWDRDGTPLAVLKGHGHTVTSAAFSSNSNRIATGSKDTTARIWSKNGETIAVLKGHTAVVNSVEFSPEGRYIVTASSDATARVWDIKGGTLAILKGHMEGINSAEFSPDGKYIVTASHDNTARVWDIKGNTLAILRGHTGGINSAKFSPDGEFIATASDDNTAGIWDTNGEFIAVLKGHSKIVNSAEFSLDGEYIVTGGQDRIIYVWDRNGTNLGKFQDLIEPGIKRGFDSKGMTIMLGSLDSYARVFDSFNFNLHHSSNVTNVPSNLLSLAFSPDGTRSVATGESSTAFLRDNNGNLFAELESPPHSLLGTVVFSPDGKFFVTSRMSNSSAEVWDIHGNLITILAGHAAGPKAVAFNSDSTHLVTAMHDNSAYIWNVYKGELETVLEGHTKLVSSVEFGPNNTVLTASLDGTVRIWDITGENLATFGNHTDKFYSAKFSPDGSRIVTTGSEGTVRVWNSNGANIAILFKGNGSGIIWSEFSSNSTRILTVGSSDNKVRIWDTEGALINMIEGAKWGTFSPNGRNIVTINDDRKVMLWDVKGSLITSRAECSEIGLSAIFSSLGTRIIHGRSDRMIDIWDINGHSVAVLSGHSAPIQSVNISPDGNRIVSFDMNGGRIWIYYQSTEALLAEYRRRLDLFGLINE